VRIATVNMRNSTKHKKALDSGLARRRYKLQDLRKAVDKVRSGEWLVKWASLQTRVPVRTIYRQLVEGASTRCGPPPILCALEEQKLVDHIFEMSDLALGLTKCDANKIVMKIVSDGRTHPWKNGKGPGRDWWDGFFRRHPDVSLRSNEKLVKARALMDRPDVLGDYFDKLESLYSKVLFQPANIHNVDETKVEARAPKTLAKTGTKDVHAIVDAPLPHITVVGCISAAGERMPPLVIHKGENILENWTNPGEEIPGALYTATPNGWITTAVFETWLEKFIAYKNVNRGALPNGEPEPVLLLFDGHTSHLSVAAAEMAQKAGVWLFQLPAHTSHRTQPLDVSCFQSWHRKLGHKAHEFYMNNPRDAITRDVFTAMMAEPWESALSAENAIAGFRRCGIFPLDRTKVLNLVKGRHPSDVLDQRPSTLLTTPAPPVRPVPVPRITPPALLLGKRKHALIDMIGELQRKDAEREADVIHLHAMRLFDVAKPPYAENAGGDPKKKRRRISGMHIDGKARVVTAGELKAAIDEAERQKRERSDSEKAEKAAKALERREAKKAVTAGGKAAKAAAKAAASGSTAPTKPRGRRGALVVAAPL